MQLKLRCTIIRYILTETEKEKTITHTVNISVQHPPATPVSPSDTSTGSLKHGQIIRLLKTEREREAQTAMEKKKKSSES